MSIRKYDNDGELLTVWNNLLPARRYVTKTEKDKGNKNEIKDVIIKKHPDKTAGRSERWDALVIFRFKDGIQIEADFASYTVALQTLRNWHSLKGVPVNDIYKGNIKTRL
jgi:hypothetical protein